MAPKRPARSPQRPIGTPGCAEVTTDQRIAKLAARQHGLVTRAQLVGAGVGRDAVKYRVMKQRLRPVQRGVYQVGPLVSPSALEMAGVLVCGPGSAISHRSAAALHGLLPHRERAVVDVMVGAEVRHRRPGIRLHRAELGQHEVTALDGIPATTAARTLLDLGSALRLRDLEQALATAEEKRLTNRGELEALLTRHPRHRGAPALRALLHARAGPALTRSAAEERFLALVRKAQLPVPETNVEIAGYEVDFLWRPERLVVEVDGFAFHSSAVQFERDRRKDSHLAAVGLRAVRVTWRQLASEPEAVLVRLAQALVQGTRSAG